MQDATRSYEVLPYTWSPNFKVRHDCINKYFKVAFPTTPYYKKIYVQHPTTNYNGTTKSSNRTTKYYSAVQCITPYFKVLQRTTKFYTVLQVIAMHYKYSFLLYKAK